MATSPRILAFAGSARRDSLNKKFLKVAIDAARAAGAEVTPIDLNDLPMPLYHGDLEDQQGAPENAKKLSTLIREHQGLLIASPEYNSMMTPLLKNTLDWCSREDDDPFPGKVAAVLSASPGPFGGLRSLTMVRTLLIHLGCHVVPVQCVLPQADKAFDAEGKLTVTRAQNSLRSLTTGLVDLCRKLT